MHPELIHMLESEEFLQYVTDGDLVSVTSALEQNTELSNSSDQNGKTAFALALEAGYKKIAQTLVSTKCFHLNSSELNPLQLSILFGYIDLAEDLLEKGANPNLRSKKVNSALLLALENDYIGLAEKMVTSGAEVNIRNEKGWTPLIWAAIKGYRKIVEFLLEHGADVHICNNDGWNAVTGAYFKQRADVVDLLLERGAVFTSKYAEAALLSAYKEGNHKVCYELIEMGASVNVADDKGELLLVKAVRNGDKTLALKLLDKGANPNARASNSLPVLCLAAVGGDTELLKAIIEAGSAVNLASSTGNTALIRAVSFNHLESVQLLLDAGADMNACKGKKKVTALMTAASEGYQSMVELLLKYGVNLHMEDEYGNSAKDDCLSAAPKNRHGNYVECNYTRIMELLTLPGGLIQREN